MQLSHDATSTGEAVSDLERSRLRILCVEDNEGDFILVREHLRDADFTETPEIVHAASVEETRKLLESSGNGSGRFDVVLLDLSLPGSRGLETFARLEESFGETAVIILSGNEDKELAVETVQGGAQDYLPKNALNSDLLSRSILYAVERQRNRTELANLNTQLERATLDLKSAQMQVIQAEKLDSLGRLAAGVAHEVKNPLATLQMGVDFFDRQGGELEDTAATMVGHMREAIKRADTIIREMVDFSRADSIKLELANINMIVHRALRIVQHEVVKNDISIVRGFAVPIPAVRIDQGKIEQVIINVIVNAIQAMADQDSDRTLELRTYWEQIKKIDRDMGLRDYERLRVQDHAVVFEVRDHGGGVPEAKLTRLFEPFFTTKPTGEGTGLGLSVAKNIIDLHRGHIEVENAEDPRGLRVRIFLKAFEVDPKEGPPRKWKKSSQTPNTHEP